MTMYVSLLHEPHGAAVDALTGPDPIGATKLVAAPSGASERIGLLFPEVAYGNPFAPDMFVQRSIFTDALKPLYLQLAVKVAPPSFLHLLPRAIIYNSIVLTEGAEPIAVYETQRPNDRDAAALPTPEQIAAARPLTVDPDEACLVLTSAGSFNYGHFLVDDLPRIKALDLIMEQFPVRRLIVLMTSWGAAMDRIRAEAVRLLAGAKVECRFLDAYHAYRLGPIFYATPVSFHPVSKNPAALSFVAERVQHVLESQAGRSLGPEQVYVTRSARHGRSLTNEAMVLERLRPLGYCPVAPETLDFVGQLHLFADAKEVIGQMGAAMTNMLFAPREAVAIHLAPSGWIEPFYWDLAVALGQGYKALYGEPGPGNEPFHLRSFTIDPDALLASLVAV